MPTHKHIRCGVFLVFVSLLAIHLLTFFLFIFSAPFQGIFTKHRLLSYYSSYAFSGPYFSEANYIQATNRFYLQYKNATGWSGLLNPEVQHFQDYHSNYMEWHTLKRSRLVKELASNAFYEFYNSDSAGLSHLKTMHEYFLLRGSFGAENPDSVIVLYLRATPNYEQPHSILVDTLTYFKYSPLELE